MAPPPPTRFSTTSCWPSRSPSFCPTSRATVWGLRLRVLHGDLAALALVAVEQVVAGLLAQNRDQLVRQVERIMHAAVHSHGADRAVHMRRVSCEDRASRAELARDPLVHHVEVA